MSVRVSRSGGDVRAGALERGGPHPRGRLALERGGPRPRGHFDVPSWRAAGATRVAIVSCVCFRFVN
jgi:hypothetical protein